MEEDERHNPAPPLPQQPYYGEYLPCSEVQPEPTEGYTYASNGIRRITWDEFLRVPPEEKQQQPPKEEPRRKRKREEEPLEDGDEEQEEEEDCNNNDNYNSPVAKKPKVTWTTRFQQLKEYKAKHNTLAVPPKWKEDKAFAGWVAYMRKKFRKRLKGDEDALSDVQFKALKNLGFEESTVVGAAESERQWKILFQQLQDYKESYGNTKVPPKWKEDRSFASWVAYMRRKFRKRLKGDDSALSDERFEALKNLGFDEDSTVVPVTDDDWPWKMRFRQLQDYKERYGNTKVPPKWKEDPALARWVKTQRRDYTLRVCGDAKAMSDARFEALQSLGFKPKNNNNNNARGATANGRGEFDTRLAQMNSFKAEYGHTRVPKGYKDVPGLRQWVIKIRNKYREKKQGVDSGITQDQIDSLNEIDFYWNEKKGNKNAPASNNNGNVNAIKADNNAMEVDSEIKVKAEAGPEIEINNQGNKHPPEPEDGVKVEEGSDSADDYEYQPRPRLSEFDERLIQLRTFKSQFNHFRVPKDLHPALWNFVDKLRKQFRDKRKGNPSDITDDQIHRLNELGFIWKKEKSNTEPGSDDDSDDNTPVVSLNLGGSGSGSRENHNGNYLRHATSNIIYEEKSDKDEKSERDNGASGASFARRTSKVIDFQNTHTVQSIGPHSRKEETVFKDTADMSFAQRVAQLKAVQRKLNHEELKPSEISFAERITQMRAFHRQHGHDNVPLDYEHSPGLLHWWLHTGKQFEENRGAFSEMELDSLYGLGIPLERGASAGRKSDWDEGHKDDVAATTTTGLHSPKIHINSWLTRFKELEHYKSIHGDTRVPIKYPEDEHFADWVQEQRRDFSRRYNGEQEALSDERFDALQKLGFEAFEMNELSPSFGQRISQLKDFFGIFGHSKVPKTYGASGASAGLRDWLLSVRSKYKLWEQGDPTALSMKELEVLHGLEFDWLGRKAKFAAKKKTESPSNNDDLGGSPAKEKAPPKLNSDAPENTYNAAASKKKAPSTNGNSSASAKKYVPFADRVRRLEQFKATHGHTKVPSDFADYEEDPGFSNWVLYQRKQFTKRVYGDKTALSDERFKALKRAGLKATKQHTTPTVSFEKRVRQLQKFLADHGDFDVTPNNNPFDAGFYLWVENMRAKFAKKQRGKGKLSDEKFEQLQNLGFR